MHKLNQLLGLLTLGSSSLLSAAQYEFPVASIAERQPTEAAKIGPAGLAKMEELSRFAMPVFEAGPAIGGRVRYELPKVLTGKSVEITMDKITDENGVRRYQTESGKAEGTCTGPLDKPTCSIRLANLELQSASNIALRNKQIDLSYKDPASRLAVRRIADLFMEQMPIGIILGEEASQLPSLSGLWWRASYLAANKRVAHSLCFNQQGGQLEGHFRVGDEASSSLPCGVCPSEGVSFCGKIKNIKLDGQLMSGFWEVPGSMGGRGWIEFQFTQQLDFTGSYGQGENGPRQGSWSGTRS